MVSDALMPASVTKEAASSERILRIGDCFLESQSAGSVVCIQVTDVFYQTPEDIEIGYQILRVQNSTSCQYVTLVSLVFLCGYQTRCEASVNFPL